MAEETSQTNPALTAPASAGGAGWVQGFSPLASGARVGDLVIQSVLGAGEFGITYLTEHQKTNKRYALKEYFPRAIAYRDGPTVRAREAHATAFAWGLDRFLSESRSVQKLKHPSIAAVHGVVEMSGTGYLGMAYELGQDFDIWLLGHQRIAPQEELDKIIGSLLQALDMAHASKLLHLDLGPECIIIRENGTPVLVDFGGFRVGLRRRLGTPAAQVKPYAAPELVAGDGSRIGPWTDIYGVAGLLYLAVTGKAPPTVPERESGAELIPANNAAQGRYRQEFLTAIDAGLAMSPQERPKSAAQWRDRLLNTKSSRFGAPKQAATGKAAQAAVDNAGAAARGEDDVAPTQAVEAPPLMENVGFRSMFFGIAGLIGGAVAGGLSSILVASLLNPECGGDSCVSPFVAPLAIAGALAGAWFGVQHAKNVDPVKRPAPRDEF